MNFESFLLTFIPLFVAIDPIGLIPFCFAAWEGRDGPTRRRILRSALLTALGVGVAFLFIGKGLLSVIGVTVDDFKVAGGLLLLALSVKGMMGGESALASLGESAGAVPLGVPLIVGPAVVTSLIMLSDQHGYAPCLAAFMANILVVALLFWQSERLMKYLGKDMIGAASKVAEMLLAAYAVMMVRHGLTAIWGK